MLEFAFYNLGGLYLGQKKMKESLNFLVKALNNSRMFDGQSSSISAKTFKKINKIIDSTRKSGVVENVTQVDNFVRQNIKILEFLEYDLETPDEHVFNIGEGISKDKNAQLKMIGNSKNCKLSKIIKF